MQFNNNNNIIYEYSENQPLQEIDHALILLSPFNGYFTVKNMEILFSWAKNHTKSFNVFFMDKASKYNLMAMGYEESEAIRRTKKQDQNLYNKIITCMKNIGFDNNDSQEKILLISHLCTNNNYLEIYKKCVELFETNMNFKNDCLSISKSFLQAKMNDFSEESLYIAVNYLLEELPIWLNTPSIIKVSSSVLIYKDFSKFWQNICYNYGLISSRQKILVKNINN